MWAKYEAAKEERQKRFNADIDKWKQSTKPLLDDGKGKRAALKTESFSWEGDT